MLGSFSQDRAPLAQLIPRYAILGAKSPELYLGIKFLILFSGGGGGHNVSEKWTRGEL